jgi:hypothetical protein
VTVRADVTVLNSEPWFLVSLALHPLDLALASRDLGLESVDACARLSQSRLGDRLGPMQLKRYLSRVHQGFFYVIVEGSDL